MGSPTLSDIVRLERQVWEALASGDGAADRQLLAEDFLGVYPTGFADREKHAAQVDPGPTVISFELLDAQLLTISSSAVMLSYRAEYERPSTPPGLAPETMYVSSLWCLRGDRWVNVFSQDTPAPSDG